MRRASLLAGLAAAVSVTPGSWGQAAPPSGIAPQRPPAAAQRADWPHEDLVIREPADGDRVAQGRPKRVTAQPLTSIHAAALREQAARPQPHWQVPDGQHPVLPGYSVDSLRQSAMVLIQEASIKLSSRAYLTAGSKAIEALHWISQAADAQAAAAQPSAQPSASAIGDLATALMAIREAEDFLGKYGTVDSESIARMVRSHGTEFLKPYDTANLNGLAAADIYLDGSRQRLTTLAAADPLAAEAIWILAQSYRLRDGGTPLGLATSVHLMRAAAGGAPDDRRIAIDLAQTLQFAGLHDESQWARMRVARLSGAADPAGPSMLVADEISSHGWLPHGGLSGETFAGAERGQVQLMQVSPDEFAAISSLAAGPPGVPQPLNSAAMAMQREAAQSPAAEATADKSTTEPADGGNRFSRALNPIRRLWQ